MTAHVGLLEDCFECQQVRGWQTSTGNRHAAQRIRHEATTETDLDLAEVCQWVADTHYPNPDNDNRCVACGEKWLRDPNAGVLQCQSYLDARIEKNFWIMRKAWRIRQKWRDSK